MRSITIGKTQVYIKASRSWLGGYCYALYIAIKYRFQPIFMIDPDFMDKATFDEVWKAGCAHIIKEATKNAKDV